MAIRDSADRAARRPLGGLNLRSAHLDAGTDDFCRGFNPSGDAARYARRVGYLPAEPGMWYWLWLLPEPE